MGTKKAVKPDNSIQADTIRDNIINTFQDEMAKLGFDASGVDNRNEKKPRYITHNQINYIFRQVYYKLFKPSKPLMCHANSIIDYSDTTTLKIIADTFLDICSMYNKSLGLMSFSYLTGITTETFRVWALDADGLNPERSAIIKYIRESHKAAQIGLLNEAPVGALAVANNDVETGLEWSKQQALTQANNTVYILSSERLQGLGLPKADSQAIEPPQ
jgi:hypothetical protein